MLIEIILIDAIVSIFIAIFLWLNYFSFSNTFCEVIIFPSIVELIAVLSFNLINDRSHIRKVGFFYSFIVKSH